MRAQAEYNRLGEATVPAHYHDAVFSNTCAPLFDAILESCGPRNASEAKVASSPLQRQKPNCCRDP